MIENKIFRTAVVVFGVVSLLCLLSHFPALHDISHDYASPEVLEVHTSLSPDALPEWTKCPLEWRALQIAFWPILIFHILFVIGVAVCWRRGPEHAAKDRAAAIGE